MSDLDLFGKPVRPSDTSAAGASPGDATTERGAPLAARMRPRTLAEFKGQERLLGPGKAIRAMLDAGRPSSMILWGPPGSGKTTLARLVAAESGTTFVAFSAVTEGIARVREIIAEADERLRSTGRRTILFFSSATRFTASTRRSRTRSSRTWSAARSSSSARRRRTPRSRS